MKLARWWMLLCVLAWCTSASAYTPPPIAGYVTDTAGKLTPEERQALAQKLADYRACSSNHVVVFLADTLAGESVEDVAYGAFNTWKIGEAKRDNGVLLLIAPTERKIRIETGKGVGGALTDLESKRILSETVGPSLKRDAFFEAADQGTTAIAVALERERDPGGGQCVARAAVPPPTASKGRGTSSPAAPAESADDTGSTFVRVFIFVTVALSFFVSFVNRSWFIILHTTFMALVGGTVIGFVLPAFFDGSLVCVLTGIALVVAILVRVYRWRNPTGGPEYGSEWTYGTSSSDSSSWMASGASSSSSFGSSSSGSSSSSSSSYSGGGGSSGGGGASDSY